MCCRSPLRSRISKRVPVKSRAESMSMMLAECELSSKGFWGAGRAAGGRCRPIDNPSMDPQSNAGPARARRHSTIGSERVARSNGHTFHPDGIRTTRVREPGRLVRWERDELTKVAAQSPSRIEAVVGSRAEIEREHGLRGVEPGHTI